ncbi:2-(hydroxymethyl)glutarate dehydrogenase-like [Portunus trituberculatus]|uniref:2-(hydroxymethyl)glutarate dehydrogenase-like n=1 Tax=Portunus trituberculatus TaxID=210409 RepID=UPI001E1CB035|nr:2-(hydroxymethyl)glutarate dehydrogenase-like [Portunus trituberculatus]
MAANLRARGVGGFGFGRMWLAASGRVTSCIGGSRCHKQGSGQGAVFGSRPFMRNLTTTSKDTKIGIIGIGQVGAAVAGNLLKNGYQVTAISDPETSRMAHLPSSIPRCSSPAEVLSLSDVVLTCLPKPTHVKTVAESSDGLLANFTAGKIWVDHSTTEYEQTIEYMKEVEGKGGYMVESPITGGLDALRKGQMVAYVGGRKDVTDAIMPILEASYMTVFYVGPTVGTAMVIKVVSNMLCCVHVVAMGEALMLGKRANIDLRTFWDGIRLSVGNSFVWETAAPVVFNGGEYDPGFSLSLQNKDLQLGYDMARKFKVPMALHQHTLSTYRAAEYQFGEEAGCYIVPRALELALNEYLQIPGFSKWEYNNVVADGSLNVTHEAIEDPKKAKE